MEGRLQRGEEGGRQREKRRKDVERKAREKVKKLSWAGLQRWADPAFNLV